MHDLSSFQRDLLVVVAGLDDPIGTDIREELEAYYPERVTAGRVYPQLTELVEKQLITKEELDGRTNIYQISRRGIRELQDRREWVDSYIDPFDELSADN
jgi:DNA-binding PadR family transcriptional regulator